MKTAQMNGQWEFAPGVPNERVDMWHLYLSGELDEVVVGRSTLHLRVDGDPEITFGILVEVLGHTPNDCVLLVEPTRGYSTLEKAKAAAVELTRTLLATWSIFASRANYPVPKAKA